ncbi:MAG: hypothetical protein IT428_08950 [Planctomycetaceae bacterium]|nr:hypothetical protein [Planctomycetaceae bacterium]
MKHRIVTLTLTLLGVASSMAFAADVGEPRLGKYRILSYGAVGKPPLVLGHFELQKGNVYKVFLPGDKPAGEGTYAYDAAGKVIVWKTGPYAMEKGWGGGFEVDREGKTHKIRLKRTTIGTNSVD